jgi:hypothetical protein
MVGGNPMTDEELVEKVALALASHIYHDVFEDLGHDFSQSKVEELQRSAKSLIALIQGECAKELDEIVLRLKMGTLPEKFAWILSQLAALADKWDKP